MNLFGLMDASGSAMEAERMRAEVVAANMANAETTHTATGETYRRQHVIFATSNGDPNFASQVITGSNALANSPNLMPGITPDLIDNPTLIAERAAQTPGLSPVAAGVRITAVTQDTAPSLKRYDPHHPDADKDGYVSYPDINPVTEMVDLMGATRAYGLNGSAVQAEKSMISTSIDLGKS